MTTGVGTIVPVTAGTGRVFVDQAFGDWLLDALAERRRTPSDLARALDSERDRTSTVSNWTKPRGASRPSAYYCRLIAKFLDVPVNEVLSRAGHPVDSAVLTEEAPRQNVPETSVRPATAEELAGMREALARLDAIIRRWEEEQGR